MHSHERLLVIYFSGQVMLYYACVYVMWQSSESSGSPSAPREAWISSMGPFTRLPAPPHITGDVSICVCV